MQIECTAFYCHPWPFWLYFIFPQYLINGTIFGKKVIEHKISSDFLYNCGMKRFSFKEEFSDILLQMTVCGYVT
jgi:hypothetical protein